MSLFENSFYRWRETYFVFFDAAHRLASEAFRQALDDLGGRFEVMDVRSDDDGQFESMTLLAPEDCAAMDITFVGAEDVLEQMDDMKKELDVAAMTDEERAKYDRLSSCNARYDVFHFEQLMDDPDEDDLLDPGALLIVLEHLATLCKGVAVDPQSGTVL